MCRSDPKSTTDILEGCSLIPVRRRGLEILVILVANNRGYLDPARRFGTEIFYGAPFGAPRPSAILTTWISPYYTE